MIRAAVVTIGALALFVPVGVAHADPAVPADFAPPGRWHRAGDADDPRRCGGRRLVRRADGRAGHRRRRARLLGVSRTSASTATVRSKKNQPALADGRREHQPLRRVVTPQWIRRRSRVRVDRGRHRRELRLARPPSALDEHRASCQGPRRPGAHRGDPRKESTATTCRSPWRSSGSRRHRGPPGGRLARGAGFALMIALSAAPASPGCWPSPRRRRPASAGGGRLGTAGDWSVGDLLAARQSPPARLSSP